MAIDPALDPAPDPAAAQPPRDDAFDRWVSDPINAEFTKKLRDEAASNRLRAKHADQEAIRKVAHALGHEYDPAAPPSLEDIVAKLATGPQQLAAARQQLRQAKIDNGLYRAIHAHGAKEVLTLGYLQQSGAMDKIAQLDPGAENFIPDLEFQISSAIEAEPALKGQSTAPRKSSAPFTPAGGPPAQLGVEEARAMDPDSVVEALRTGRFNELLGRNR